MPYGAMAGASGMPLDHISPFATTSTPSDVNIQTPSADQATSPMNVPSPLSVTLRKKTLIDRAYMFLEGRHDDLLRTLNAVERRTVSTWLYHFWLFSFSTAKYWGRGPRIWDSRLLGWDDYSNMVGTTTTPSNNLQNSPGRSAAPHLSQHYEGTDIKSPAALCKWSIHTSQVFVDDSSDLLGDDDDDEDRMDTADNTNSRAWPPGWDQPPIQDRLRDGLLQSHFSFIGPEKLPMAVSQVLRKSTHSESDLLLESVSFAIIGRNFDLVEELMGKAYQLKVDLNAIHPFHLETTYLDGSSECCNVLDLLLQCYYQDTKRGSIWTNDLGHTVLDNLMISILKSHTSCVPGFVHPSWRSSSRFPGEEVNICGRWDADSPCWRALISQGNVSVPNEWKHKFCHTSTQVICQCIISLNYVAWGLDSGIKSGSGLFITRCHNTECGMKLQMTPLHTVVVVAFLLASHGREGEDLFGILSVLMTLLSLGLSPIDASEVSIPLLLQLDEESYDDDNDEDGRVCSHELMRPRALAVKLRSKFSQGWSHEVRLGWTTFVKVLELSEKVWAPKEWKELARAELQILSPEMEMPGYDPLFGSLQDDHEMYQGTDSDKESETSESCGVQECCEYNVDNFSHRNYFGHQTLLGTLWAIVRTEMLTYRRLKEGDAWNSENCDTNSLLHYLETGDDSRIGLIEKNLMSSERCACGLFEDDVRNVATMETVSENYFANLEDWTRIKVITKPVRTERYWY